MSEIAITQKDNGKTFETNQGNSILIRVPENPSTGYCWKVSTFDEQVIRLTDSDFVMQPGTAIGGGGIRTLTFEAQSPGTVRLELRLRQEWDPKNSEMDRFHVIIQIQE